MNRSPAALASIFLGLLASLFLTQPAQARDRPGTPNGGNKSTGPGSLGIRNELNASGQRGFDAATTLHLSRHYQ